VDKLISKSDNSIDRKAVASLLGKQLKYKRVEQELRRLARTLPPGAKLPAERDLAIEYSCNFLTVRKALKQLVDDSLIVRRVGSGTFIAENRQEPPSEPVRSGKPRLGILTYQNVNPYAFAVIQAIAHLGLSEQFELHSCWISDFSDEGSRRAEMTAREASLDAYILPWFPHDMTPDIYGFVRRSNIPVSLPMLIPGLEKYCFEESHLFGASVLSITEALCAYFLRLGHKHIAFLGPDSPSDKILQERLGAYIGFNSRENLATICSLVKKESHAMDRLTERWKQYVGDLAVIAYDDEHALRFMTAMHKIGLSAPKDYAIIGYNNNDASHYSDPPLSSVRQNFGYLAEWMVKNALALMKGMTNQSKEAPSLDLIVRATCGGAGRIDDQTRADLLRLKLNICEDAPALMPAEIESEAQAAA